MGADRDDGRRLYFVLADSPSDLPPVALAASSLATGALMLAALGVAGVLPMDTAAAAGLRGHRGRLARPGARARRRDRRHRVLDGHSRQPPPGLAPRLVRRAAEVVAGVAFAWLLLDQLPGPFQLAGGALIVAGVVVVKLGEGRLSARRSRPRVVAAMLPERS